MVDFLEDAILGLDKDKASHASAHAVHFVQYRKAKDQIIPIVYKQNKHGKAIASVRETAFSELARLFMVPHLTPPQHIVRNQAGEVVGTAVEHMSLSIMQKESLYDLHVVSELPTDLKKYKGSYIYYCGKDVTKNRCLFYVSLKGTLEIVKIDDLPRFNEELNSIKPQEATTLHLSGKQVNALITSNGGHTPQKTKYYYLPKFKKPGDSSEFLMELQGWELHLKPKLPKDLKKYKGSYIYRKKGDTAGCLYYINLEGKSEEVRIKNLPTFEENLRGIRSSKKGLLHLSREQVEAFITSDGGHIPQEKSPPFKFLNETPQGFFSELMKKAATGELSIDMESLASVFTASYVLEEDDLHKGNIGFYVKQQDGKPVVVFFKIDHDLLLTSIMSFVDSRMQNWTNYSDGFPITPRDLARFPDIVDSDNYYWPTKARFLVKWGDNKVHSSHADREAFKALKDNREFTRHKWKQFLNDILIPEDIIRSSLLAHLSKDKDLSEINLITQAAVERMAQLRVALFSTPAFCCHMMTPEGREDLLDNCEKLKEQIMALPVEGTEQDRLLKEVIQRTADYQAIFATFSIEDIDFITNRDENCPLHVAIRLGNYRFEKTDFSQINRKNLQGEYPIDIAADLAKHYVSQSEKFDPSKDPLLVIKSLLNHGARMTPKVARLLGLRDINIYRYEFNSDYLEKKLTNYQDLTKIIMDINRDMRLTLDMQKKLVLRVVEKSIDKLTSDELEQFNRDLNGDKSNKPKPEFLFISQARNAFWLIRILFGLYTDTKTKKALTAMIDERIALINEKTALMNEGMRGKQGLIPKAFMETAVGYFFKVEGVNAQARVPGDGDDADDEGLTVKPDEDPLPPREDSNAP